MNLGSNKITGVIWHEYWTTMHNSKISECNTIPQQIRSTAPNFPTKKALKINLASLESNSMTNDIFGMTASVETNYHIASNEIDRIFDANVVHCTEVKHSTSGDCEQLKY